MREVWWAGVALVAAGCTEQLAAEGTSGDCRNEALACSPGFECVLVPTDGEWACMPVESNGPSFALDTSPGGGADAGGGEPDTAAPQPDVATPDVADEPDAPADAGGAPDAGPSEDIGGGGGAPDVGDTPPPLLGVTLTTPGPYLSGTVAITATTSGPPTVLGVEFQVDGLAVHTDLIPPFTATIDTTAWAPGPHTITAATADAAGQTAEDDAQAVFDNDPPVIEGFAPAQGATLFFEDGAIDLAAEVTDAAPISSVAFRVNGLLVAEVEAPPYTATVEPATLLITEEALPKALEVTVTAADAQGQESELVHGVTVHRRLGWSHVVDGEVWAPAADVGGTIVAATLSGRIVGLNGVDLGGGQVFAVELGKELSIGPVADPAGGRFFLCGTDGKVRAMDLAGGELWNVNVGGACGGTPVVAGGQLVVPVSGGDVVALAPSDGGQLWKGSLPDLISASPAVAADGTVYIGAQDGSLYALQGGSVAWSAPTGGEIWSRPAVGPAGEEPTPTDGAVFFGSNDGKVYAVSASGGALWQREVAGQVWGALHATQDAVYVAGTGKWVYRLDRDSGEEAWSAKVGGISYSSPVLGADGTLYIGSTTGALHAFDAETGAERFAFPTGGSVHATPLLVGDRVVFGCVDQSVYSIWRYGASL